MSKRRWWSVWLLVLFISLGSPQKVAAQAVADSWRFPMTAASTRIEPGFNYGQWVGKNYNCDGSFSTINLYHMGIDVITNNTTTNSCGMNDNTSGMPVYAVANGKVTFARWGDYPGDSLVIEHTVPGGTKYYSAYGHIAINSGIKSGTIVSKGQYIATVAHITDRKWEDHLHFEIRDVTNAFNFGFLNTMGKGYVSSLGGFNSSWLNACKFLGDRGVALASNCIR